MASEVQVANLAASRIGTETRITSLDDDRTVARTLKAVWEIERRATIRDGSWNFALKAFVLAAEVVAVPHPWGYSFRLPPDFLRLHEPLGISPDGHYRIAGKSLLSDSAGPLYGNYFADIPEPALWDDLFAEAFACRLAWKTGRKIAGSGYDQDAGWREYRDAIAQAKRVDALENPPLEQAESGWIEARFTGRLSYGADPLRWG